MKSFYSAVLTFLFLNMCIYSFAFAWKGKPKKLKKCLHEVSSQQIKESADKYSQKLARRRERRRRCKRFFGYIGSACLHVLKIAAYQMALSLSKKTPEIVDFFGGDQDLQVIHSFIDTID